MQSRLKLRPHILSAREVRQYDFGTFRATFFDNIVSADIVHYAFVVILYDRDGDEPIAYLTSERNDAPFDELLRKLGIASDPEGTGSHFLCMFDEDGHHNYGASDDWGDADKFERRVLDDFAKSLDLPPQT